MMGIVNILAFILSLILLAVWLKRTLVEVLPVNMSIWILMLYLLAWERKLLWIDGVAVIICVGVLLLMLRWRVRTENAGKALLIKVRELRVPAFLCFCILVTMMLIVNQNKLVSEWDDLNYWGTYVKALFYNQGFEPAYQNVSTAFGDYPPAAQLAEYWLLHIMGKYKDGYIFAGYYIFGLSYLAFMMKYIKKNQIFNLAVFSVILPVLISVVDVSWYISLSPDVLMGLILAVGMLIVFENRGKVDTYTRFSLIILSSVLVLVKSIGVLWFLFLQVFFCLCNSKKEFLKRKDNIWLVGIPLMSYFSWVLLCTMRHRTTNLTSKLVSTGKSMLLGTFSINENWKGYLWAFVKAFLFKPLHQNQTKGVDFTPIMFLAGVLVLLYAALKKNQVTKQERKRLLWFFGFMAAVTYLYILGAHLTIFSREKGYLEAENMIRTISRYGTPFTLGSMLFTIGLFLGYDNGCIRWEKWKYVSLAGVIVLCMNVQVVREAFRYHEDTGSVVSPSITEAVAEYQPLLTAVSEKEEVNGRILVCDDLDMYSYVCLMFMMSPYSIVECKMNDDTSVQDIEEYLDSYQAKYIYFQSVNDSVAKEVAQMWNLYPKTGVLYKVNEK